MKAKKQVKATPKKGFDSILERYKSIFDFNVDELLNPVDLEALPEVDCNILKSLPGLMNKTAKAIETLNAMFIHYQNQKDSQLVTIEQLVVSSMQVTKITGDLMDELIKNNRINLAFVDKTLKNYKGGELNDCI